MNFGKMSAFLNRAFDPGLQGNRNEPMFSDRSFRTSVTPVSLIAAPVSWDATAGGVVLGPQFQVDGEKFLRLYLAWTKGTGTDTGFRIQAKFSHTPGGTQFPLAVLKVDTSAAPYVITADDETIYVAAVTAATGAKSFVWALKNSVGYVQFWQYAATPGTGTIDQASYTVGY